MSSSRLSIMIILLALLTGCTQPGPTPQASRPPSGSQSAPSTGTSSDDPPEKAKEPRNDLKSGKLSRKLSSGDVAVRVNYATSLPIAEWTASATKPIGVTATASMAGDEPKQKIYLSKLTITLDARDETGEVDPPQPLTDEAAIDPGFLVSDPASYRQEFFIPGLIPGSTTLTLRMRYELLLESSSGSGDSETKDYSRRTVTDIVVVPIAAD